MAKPKIWWAIGVRGQSAKHIGKREIVPAQPTRAITRWSTDKTKLRAQLARSGQTTMGKCWMKMESAERPFNVVDESIFHRLPLE